MQSLLAKLAALAVLGAGFAATGDLRRLVDRGARLLNATTVPTREEQATAATPVPALSPAPPAAPAPPAVSAAPSDARDAPVGRPVDAPRLPTSTLDSLDLRTLSPGTRLAVWVGTPPTLVVFDLVDPSSGEVLEQQLLQAGGAPHALPRRVRLEGDAGLPRQIVRGGSLRLTPLGIAYGGSPVGPTETLGPVRALQIQ